MEVEEEEVAEEAETMEEEPPVVVAVAEMAGVSTIARCVIMSGCLPLPRYPNTAPITQSEASVCHPAVSCPCVFAHSLLVRGTTTLPRARNAINSRKTWARYRVAKSGEL